METSFRPITSLKDQKFGFVQTKLKALSQKCLCKRLFSFVDDSKKTVFNKTFSVSLYVQLIELVLFKRIHVFENSFVEVLFKILSRRYLDFLYLINIYINFTQ